MTFPKSCFHGTRFACAMSVIDYCHSGATTGTMPRRNVCRPLHVVRVSRLNPLSAFGLAADISSAVLQSAMTFLRIVNPLYLFV
jgi:hypothetical protein